MLLRTLSILERIKFMKRGILIAASLGLLLGAIDVAKAAVLTVKEYQTVSWNTGIDNENTIAAVGGLVFGGQVTGAASLIGTDIVIAGQVNPSLFNSWVAAGGTLIIHDWGQQVKSLPGLAGASSASYNSGDINVVNVAHPIVVGPFGTITNTLLDGGNSSIHGAWLASSLNTGSDPLAGPVHSILSSTLSSSVSVFEYSYGLGHIIYANIPLEAYTDSNPLVTGPQPAGLRVYAKNELAYAASLSNAVAPVPEPSSIALIGMAVASFGGYFGWRRSKLLLSESSQRPS
jgi:hypothetical protein